MKRIFIFCALLFCSDLLFSQIVIEQQETSPLVKICHGLYYHRNSGRVTYSIIVNTTNQFDEPFAIALGETKQEAIVSLDNLLKLSSQEVGTNAQFDSHYGYKVEVNVFNVYGTKSCVFSSNNHAGIFSTKTKQLIKLKNKLISFEE